MRRNVPSRPEVRFLCAAVLAFCFGTSALAAPTPPKIPLHQPRNEFRVHTIDVDQGQAVLVQTLQGKNILLDAGEDYASPRLIGYLKKAGVKKIDWLVISHRHMDHIAGVPALAKNFSVEHLVTPWTSSKVPKTAIAWLAPLRRDISKGFGPKNRPKFHTAITGRTFNFGGGAKAEVLWPPKPTGGVRMGDYNQESVVMRVSQKAPKSRATSSFVVGGDLVWQIERHLAKTMPGKLRADGLVGNHHGSKGSFERSYLEAIAGQSSPLLAQGPNSSSPVSKLARTVMDLSRQTNAKELANQVGLLLYQGNQGQTGSLGQGESFAAQGAPKPAAPGKISPLARKIAATLRKDTSNNGSFPWITYSAGQNNPYHHPNSERMALATMLGSTMLGTDVHGSVVMTRKVDKGGKWQGGWQGHTMGNLGLPNVANRMPVYKRKKDPKNPYNDVAREANYVFAVDHPDPTVSWTTKEQYIAAPGKTQIGVFLQAARQARKGRTAFVRSWRQLRASGDKSADKMAAKAKKNPWHGQKLDGLPWDQEANSIWTATQNSRLARSRAGRSRSGRWGWRVAKLQLRSTRSTRSTRRPTRTTLSLKAPSLRPWSGRATSRTHRASSTRSLSRNISRNSNMGRPLSRWGRMLRARRASVR